MLLTTDEKAVLECGCMFPATRMEIERKATQVPCKAESRTLVSISHAEFLWFPQVAHFMIIWQSLPVGFCRVLGPGERVELGGQC